MVVTREYKSLISKYEDSVIKGYHIQRELERAIIITTLAVMPLTRIALAERLWKACTRSSESF
jgi:hypothetical protein